MSGTLTKDQIDQLELKDALNKIVGLNTANDTEYDNHDLVKALSHVGVTRWSDFLMLSVHDIMDLSVPGASPADEHTALLVTMKRKLHALLAFYHEASRARRGAIDIRRAKKATFDAFRVSKFQPDASVVPFTVYRPTTTALEAWQKSIKPNRSEFKVFKDELYWNRAKEQFVTAITSQGLAHLIDPNYKVVDKELDKSQCDWLYQGLVDIMQHPAGKAIVIKHKDTKDTRNIWAEIVDHYDNSVSSTIRAQQISTYVTSVRLHTVNWRGPTGTFIHHFKEQLRVYNEISPVKYTDAQCSQFLETCVQGTEHLAQVRHLRRQAAKAAGVVFTLTFDEYVAALVEACSIRDGANTSSTNPRSNRSVNMTEFIFDDGSTDHDVVYEANLHETDFDLDTPIEYIVNQASTNDNNNGPRRVLMNQATWKSLSQDDKTNWDKLSEDGKRKILNYAASKDDKAKS